MKPTFLMALCLLVSVRMAAAQTHQEEGVFVHGGVFASIDREGHYDAIPVLTSLSLPVPTDSGGTVAAGTVGGGVFLRPFLSVRADVSIGGERSSSDSAQPLDITSLLGTIIGIPTVFNSTRSRSRTGSVDVLLAYHLPSMRRVRAAVLGGAGFVRDRTHFTSELALPVIPALPGVIRPLQPQRVEYTFVTYSRAPVVGIDGEIALGQNLAVVSQLRVVGLPGSVSIRPGVTIRWHP